MFPGFPRLYLLALVTALVFPAASQPARESPPAAEHWATWRGPLHSGVSPTATPPLTWSETENVRWKTPLPGEGHSTPVVWGDHILLTAAFPVGEEFEPKPDTAEGAHDNRLVRTEFRFIVLNVDRQTGKVRWQTTVATARPKEGGHFTGTLASNSPVTDGKRIYAFFGSRGLHALDFDGRVLWSRDLGHMNTRHAHGEGASPALHDNTLVINWDHEDASFIAAFDPATGKERWRTPRDEATSWSTPLITAVDGKPQVIVPATNRIRGYDLATGNTIWECGGLSRNVCASPVVENGVVFVSNSYDWRIVMAINPAGARGNITDTDHVLWTFKKNTSYVPSPLVHDGSLFVLGHLAGILTRLDTKTGATLEGPFRLRGINNVFASPVLANGHLYVCDRDGTATVVKVTPEKLHIVAMNQLDDRFSASPVPLRDTLLLRGETHLYSLGLPPTPVD